MTTQTRTIDTPDVAKMLRKALRAEFPGVTFKVRSRRYTGGSSIDVQWTDGPTEPAVQAVCNRYRGSEFDSQRDLKEYRDSLVTSEGEPELVHFSADHVMASRLISQPIYDQVASEIAAATGQPCDLSRVVWVDGQRVDGSVNGAGWNTTYRADVLEGEIYASATESEYGGTLAHRALRNRVL